MQQAEADATFALVEERRCWTSRCYILRNAEAVEEPDYEKWVERHQDSYEDVRCVASTKVKFGTVLTTFLGMNLTPSKADPPAVRDQSRGRLAG